MRLHRLADKEEREIFRKATVLGIYVMDESKTMVMELIRVEWKAQRFKANWLWRLQVFPFQFRPSET